MTVKALRRRFTMEEYHQIAKAGILSEDDRVELMEGEIVEMIPIQEMIESYSKPTPQGYKEIRKYQSGKHLTSHYVSDLKLSVDQILG